MTNQNNYALLLFEQTWVIGNIVLPTFILIIIFYYFLPDEILLKHNRDHVLTRLKSLKKNFRLFILLLIRYLGTTLHRNIWVIFVKLFIIFWKILQKYNWAINTKTVANNIDNSTNPEFVSWKDSIVWLEINDAFTFNGFRVNLSTYIYDIVGI